MMPLSKPIIGREERSNIRKVLDSGLLARGRYNEEFENTFAKYTGTKFAVSTSSGTTALHAALLAADIKKGDCIMTSPLSFIATSNAVIHCGGRLKFVDIDPATFNISSHKIEEALEKLNKRGTTVKGLLIVHLYGLPCQMDHIMRIVRKYNLLLIEDCCQAHGAEFKGKKVGSFGTLGIFSFYGSKNITTGEGGMVVTNKRTLYRACQCLVDQGRSSKFIHRDIGFNYRMSNIAAAIGVAQLKKIDMLNRIRIKNAAYLSRMLSGIKWLRLPVTPKDTKHVFHQYTIRIKNRDRFIAYLNKKGIAAAPNYPLPIYKQPAYKARGYGKSCFPEAEMAAKEIVNIPVHPGLTKGDMEKIVQAVRHWR